jgi:outer membrane protein assembly factor BamB
VHDGSVRWSLPGRGLEDLAFGGPDPANPSLLVTIVAGGATRVLRLGDGRPVAQGRVDLPDRPEFVDAFGDGRRLYVRAVGGGGDTLTAYDLHTLRRIWRVTGMVRVAAYLCGPAVCGVRPDGVAALDPAGGRVLWQTPALENAMPIMPGWVGVNEGSMDRYALIQAATGRRIGGLSGAVVAAPDGSGAFLLRDTVNPPDRTAVNRIDTASGTVALRGTIDRIGEQGCLAATANRLACTTRDARLMVVSVPG